MVLIEKMIVVLFKASFEEIMNIFVKAAVFGESDNMKGVSSSVLAGQVCKSGTNSFDVMLSLDDILNIESKKYKSKSKTSELDINMADLDNLDDLLVKEFKNNIDITDNVFKFGLNIIKKNEKTLNEIKLNDINLKFGKDYVK